MADLKQDMVDKMSQSEFYGMIGGNAVKAFITAIILIVAFIKLLDLIGFYGYLLSVGQIIVFTCTVMIIYYHYFWSVTKTVVNGWGTRLSRNDECILTIRDFFYTTKINSDDQFMALAASWFAAGVIYVGLGILLYTAKYCLDNSGSESTMSILRIVVIGLVATAFYIYTQRYSLNVSFWGTILKCTLYGFTLSISAYLLGMIVGISNMVFGVPITVAILTLQIAFTSIYTYSDLLKWSKDTHKRLVRAAEEAAKKAKDAENPNQVS